MVLNLLTFQYVDLLIESAFETHLTVSVGSIKKGKRTTLFFGIPDTCEWTWIMMTYPRFH